MGEHGDGVFFLSFGVCFVSFSLSLYGSRGVAEGLDAGIEEKNMIL